MGKTHVTGHERRRDGKVIAVSEHLREIPDGKSGVASAGGRGPSAATIADMEELDFDTIDAQVKSGPINGPPATHSILRKAFGSKSVEIMFLGVRLAGTDNVGRPLTNGFYAVNTGEPLGRDVALAYLEEKLRREFGPDAEINTGFPMYHKYVRGKNSGLVFDTSHLPEWLQEESPRVPAEDVLAAADHFATQTKGTPLQGKTVVLSGEFPDIKRDEAVLFLETLGARSASGVSKKVDVVIADPSSTSSKVKKAQALGIPVVSPEEVLGYPQDNLAAWRTEMYRRYRIGAVHTMGEKYMPGPVYENSWAYKFKREDAKDHEAALDAAERMVPCVHLWGPTVTVDGRSPVLRTGNVSQVRECQRCGERNVVSSRSYNYSGD